MLEKMQQTVSLYAPVKGDGTRQVKDYLKDETNVHPFDSVVQSRLGESVRKVLSVLSPREEKILRMRFGIGEQYDHSLEEVSLFFSLTRERIRQIEVQALKKLRHPELCCDLSGFL